MKLKWSLANAWVDQFFRDVVQLVPAVVAPHSVINCDRPSGSGTI